MKDQLARGHILIEAVRPQVDCGRYRAKAVVGDVVDVSADIIRCGTEVIRASVRYRGPSDARWQESEMTLVDNDRWSGSFRPAEIGRYRYAIEAWTDHFATWRRDLQRRVEAGQEVTLELEEGARLVEARLEAIPARRDRGVAERAVHAVRTAPRGEGVDDERVRAMLDEALAAVMVRHPDRTGSTTSKPALEVTVDRERARFGAWYEFFPRSTGTATSHGTFETAAVHLETVAAMGFDVVYLPPIHPIGTTHRKGRNNTLVAERGDVGSPWAIGSPAGGHDGVHPDLGTLEDFDSFVATARRLGLEVALDFAIQCSPDHPWVTEHPEWFHHRPDGSIKYAENPPKKYQDIYPVNFDTADKQGLWLALKDVVDHWISHGVKIFRVDNPHTKSFPFWEWIIGAVQAEHPDVLFLSEAFTRPKVMKALAKLGFTQSYTYFTWRNSKHDIQDYLTELVDPATATYFRPNFFANTPDILHEYLQKGGPAAFKIRLVLASMLSPSYGIYSGYELYENEPAREGSEEYLDSEKYQLRPRNPNAPGSLVPYIKRINEIRRKHPALQEHTNLRFHHADKDSILVFSKGGDGGDAIVVVVNLNPFHWEEATVTLDLGALGIDPFTPFEATDLLTGDTFTWSGAHNYVRLDPFMEPAHILRIGG